MQLEPSSKIYLATSKIKNAGRGVFAKVAIKKGESIEQCPVIPLSEYDTAAITEGMLISYLFYFGKNMERAVIALGFGSIYNHVSSPNAYYKEHPEKQVLEFIALKDMQKDEEITVNYNREKNKHDKIPLWFEE